MNKNHSTKTFLLAFLFSFLFIAVGAAQEKESKSCNSSCCDGKTKMSHQSDADQSKQDHSMMNHQNMDETTDLTEEQTTEPVVKEVAVNIQAWNTVCPVRGEEIDPEANKIEYNGKVYGFCCNSCDSKFKKDPEKYSKNLSEDGKSFIGTP